MIKIIVERRSDDYKAYLESDKGAWDRGRSRAEAVGELLFSHPEKFYIEIEVKP